MRPESFSLNPYEVLGVATDATTAEIQAAYRQHAMRWHPDRNPNDEYAMRMMQRVNAAWAILKDADRRAEFDRSRRGETRSASGPQAWRRPRADSSPGREWYSPPPAVISCPRCDSTNEEGSEYCYSCGYAFGEGRSSHSSMSYQAEHSSDAAPGKPAGLRVRFFAHLTDAVLVAIVALVFASLFEVAIVHTVDAVTVYFWIFALTGMLYHTVATSSFSGTLGKRMLGISVVWVDGSKADFQVALVRNLCYLLSLGLLGIGFLMIAFRRDKRGLHDLICDTKVVYR